MLHLLCSSTLEPTYEWLMSSKLLEYLPLSSLPVFTMRTLIPVLRVPPPSAFKAATPQDGTAAHDPVCEKAMLYCSPKEDPIKAYIPRCISCALKLHCLNGSMSLRSQEKGPFSFCWWLLFPRGSDWCLCTWDKGCTRLWTLFHVPLCPLLLNSFTKVVANAAIFTEIVMPV